MYKVYLAIGNSDVEDYIKTRRPVLEQQLKDTVNFVGTTVYKEGALQGVKDYHPDLLLLRESLQGTIDILDLIYKIRMESPKTRVILITKQRDAGDAFLAAVVQYQIYDIFIGDKLNIRELLKRIVYPANFAAVAHLVPKINIDSQGQMIYQAPDIEALVQQRLEQILAEKAVAETSDIEKDSTQEVIANNKTAEIVSEENQELKTDTLSENLVESVTSEVIMESEIEQTKIVEKNDEQTLKPANDVEDDLNTDSKPILPIIDFNDPDFLKNLNLPDDDELSEVIIPVRRQAVVVETKDEEIESIFTSEKKLDDTPIELPTSPLFPDKEPEKLHQNPYTSETYTPTDNKKNTPSKKGGFSLFKKKAAVKTISRQIITFWGAANGVGNSHIAFSTAITMANQGYHVIYIDLNDRFSAIESMTQLGFEDVGLETMLQNVPKHEPNKEMSINEKNVLTKFGMGIGTVSKILPFTDKRDFLYKTYSNMPTSLSFAFFSQNRFSRKTGTEYNIEFLKEVNLLLSTEFGYDIIILDAPADVTNRATQLALAYSNKVFTTMTQDKTTLNKLFHDMKFLAQNRLNIRDKCYFIVNKFENTNFTYNNLANTIAMNLQFESVNLLTIPNMSKEFINAIYTGIPIIMSTKNKEFIKIINDIAALIES